MARKNKFKQANNGTSLLPPNNESNHTTSSSLTPATITKTKLAHPTTKSTRSTTNPKAMDQPDLNPPSRRKTTANPWPDGDQPPQFLPHPSTPSTHPRGHAAILPQQHQPPPSVPAAAPLLPPDIAALAPAYDIHTLAITSSSKISAKVSRLLAQLENAFDLSRTGQKPAIVALVAKAGAANKLVSVVEVAKRVLGEQGARWWQYSGVQGRVEEVRGEREGEGEGKEKGGRRLGGKDDTKGEEVDGGGMEDVRMDEGGEGVDEEEEEQVFETMVEKERKKVRTVPVLTIYLSRVQVTELKGRYGEQASNT